MESWIETLRADLQKEFGDRPPTAALASVCHDGNALSAACRMVVVRDIDPAGTLLVATDNRSDKFAELIDSPLATLLFWCPSTKRQTRVAGGVDFPFDARIPVWQKLSDRARALFTWPAPGSPQPATEVAESIASDAPVPEAFVVLRLSPGQVETLDLNPTPHQRMRWTRSADGWSAEAVNP